MKLWIRSILVVCLLANSLAVAADHPSCANSISKCPVKGCGGGDPKLDTLKNRTDLPNSPLGWTIPQIIALKQPTHWTSGQDRSSLTDEGQAVILEAVLVHAKTAEPESCNCYLTGAPNNDIHLNLTATASQTLDDSVVAEITPRVRPAGWTLTKLSNLYRQKAYVRVTGWLMFDSEHVDGNGGPRVYAMGDPPSHQS